MNGKPKWWMIAGGLAGSVAFLSFLISYIVSPMVRAEAQRDTVALIRDYEAREAAQNRQIMEEIRALRQDVTMILREMRK